MIRIIFYIFVGYLIFQVVRLIVLAAGAAKKGSFNTNSGGKREKDISRVAKILDEKRPAKKSKKSK